MKKSTLLIALFLAMFWSVGSVLTQNPVSEDEFVMVAKNHNAIMQKILNGDAKTSPSLDAYLQKEVEKIAKRKLDFSKLKAEETVNRYCFLPYSDAINLLQKDGKINAKQASELKNAGKFLNEIGTSNHQQFSKNIEGMEKMLKTNKNWTEAEKRPVLMFYSVAKASSSLYTTVTTPTANQKGCADACCKCIKNYKTGLIIADGLGAVAGVLACILVPEPATCIYAIIKLTTFGSAAYLKKKCKQECF